MTKVEKIHHEIDTAEDRLLAEAKRIIALNIDTSDKAERLERIGFTGSQVVVRNRNKKQTIVNSKAEAELIEYYKQNYPFQKFLTIGEFDRICDKYKLIYAPVSSYKKDVPEKNIKDIENSGSLRDSDKEGDLYYCEPKYSGTLEMSYVKAMQAGLPKRINKHLFGWQEVDGYLKQNYPQVSYISYITSGANNYTEKRTGLFIAAPKSHFNLTGLKKNGKGFFSFTIMPEPKDPIVFRYVRGGIQVITKWGIEAEDKDLVNEKLN